MFNEHDTDYGDFFWCKIVSENSGFGEQGKYILTRRNRKEKEMDLFEIFYDKLSKSKELSIEILKQHVKSVRTVEGRVSFETQLNIDFYIAHTLTHTLPEWVA